MPLSHGLLALVVALIWGFNFVVIKVGVDTMPPLLLCALRFAFAAFPAVLLVPRPQVSWQTLGAFGFTLGVLKFGLIFSAIALGMPAGLASLVMQSQAFFTILFAIALLGERPASHQVAGGSIACLGLVLIAWPRIGGGDALPFVMTVLAAAMWGIANIVSKRAGRIDMLGFVVWASLVPPLPLLALSLWIDGPQEVAAAFTGFDLTSAAVVAFLAYPTTILAFAIWGFLLARHPAATVTPFSLLVPVAGLLSASLFLGETILPIEAAGGGIIVLGLAITVLGGRLVQWARPTPPAVP